MLNWYEGYLDTNPVLLLAIDKMKVVFEFYFSDVTLSAQERNRKSLDVSERSQDRRSLDLRVRAARTAVAGRTEQEDYRCGAKPEKICFINHYL
jgi:hypothetical protein